MVSDDSETDAIEKICSRFGKLLEYTSNTNRINRGQGNIWNLLTNANGKYIIFLFDDDLLDPFFIQKTVTVLEQYEDISFAATLRRIIDERNEQGSILNPFSLTHNTKIKGIDLISLITTELSNPIGEFSSVLFRRDSLLSTHGSCEELFSLQGQYFRGLGDVCVFLKEAEDSSVAILGEPLVYIRKHANANSNPSYNPDFIYAITDWEITLEYAIKNNYLFGEKRELANKRLADHYRHWAARFPTLHTKAKKWALLTSSPTNDRA
jgi:hypothetical protein